MAIKRIVLEFSEPPHAAHASTVLDIWDSLRELVAEGGLSSESGSYMECCRRRDVNGNAVPYTVLVENFPEEEEDEPENQDEKSDDPNHIDNEE